MSHFYVQNISYHIEKIKSEKESLSAWLIIC